MSGRKGQMFIIMGVIFIVLFATLKTYYSTSSDVKRKQYLEESLEKERYLVLKQEAKKIVAMAYDQNISAVQNFFNFVKDKLYGKDLSLELFFVKANFSTVIANANTSMNVSVLNMLGKAINNLNLTFNNTSQFISSLDDNSTYSTNFTFNTSVDVNYTLTVSYTTSSGNTSYSISVPVILNKGRVIGFYDLALIGSTTRHQDIFQENYLI